MPDISITRLREVLALRLEQGYTKDEIAAAGGITPADIDTVLDRDILDGVTTSHLAEIMRALFVDEGYVFNGVPTVRYSPCSMSRLLDSHYHVIPSTSPE